MILLCLQRPGLAWNKVGHWTVAAIAYNDLGNTPLRKKIVLILRNHPIYTTKWKPIVESLPPDDQGAALFMLAASWPDDIKNDSSYRTPGINQNVVKTKLNPQHFIDYPYVPPGQAVTGAEPGAINILSALKTNFQIARGSANMGSRAIALCWLIHLTGDVHQPLHCVTKFAADQPDGDAGGNFDWVTMAAPTPAHPQRVIIQEIHAIWDNLLGPTSLLAPAAHPNFSIAASRAASIAGMFRRSDLPEIATGDAKTWSLTSRAEAIHVAYLNSALQYTSTQSFEDEKPDDAPDLPPNYETDALLVGQRKIALAGYRLADTIVKMSH